MSHNPGAKSGMHSLMIEVGLLPLPEENPNKPGQIHEEEDSTTAEKSEVRDAAKDQIGHGERFD